MSRENGKGAFLGIKSDLDEIREMKGMKLKEAGKKVARYMSGKDRATGAQEIGKLLAGFPEEDKVMILTYAVLELI